MCVAPWQILNMPRLKSTTRASCAPSCQSERRERRKHNTQTHIYLPHFFAGARHQPNENTLIFHRWDGFFKQTQSEETWPIATNDFSWISVIIVEGRKVRKIAKSCVTPNSERRSPERQERNHEESFTASIPINQLVFVESRRLSRKQTAREEFGRKTILTMDLSTMWFGAAQTTGVFSTNLSRKNEKEKKQTNKQLSKTAKTSVGFPYATIRLIKSTEKMWKKIEQNFTENKFIKSNPRREEEKKKQKPNPKKSKSIENDFIEVFTATLSFDRQVVSSAICCVRRCFG